MKSRKVPPNQTLHPIKNIHWADSIPWIRRHRARVRRWSADLHIDDTSLALRIQLCFCKSETCFCLLFLEKHEVGSKCDMQASRAQARARAHTQVCDRETEQAGARPAFPWNAVVLVLPPRDPPDALITASFRGGRAINRPPRTHICFDGCSGIRLGTSL